MAKLEEAYILTMTKEEASVLRALTLSADGEGPHGDLYDALDCVEELFEVDGDQLCDGNLILKRVEESE